MGHSKHRKSGHAGHNADKQQLAREVNRELDELAAQKKRKRQQMHESVRDLFKKVR